jgi:CMP-N-acetylneuraminic acid synthetase
MDPLIIIMARAGSKRIPGKNFKKLNEKPLIDYTFEAAISSKISQYIWCSTDKFFEDDYYYYGIQRKINFMPRSEIDANDEMTVQQALINILKEHKERFKTVIMLLPTNPFRDYSTLIDVYTTFNLQTAKTLVTTNKIIENVHWTIPLDANNIKRSQDLQDKHCLNGAVWISDIDTLLNKKTFYHEDTFYNPINFIEGFDIDTQEDWDVAEIIARGLEVRK